MEGEKIEHLYNYMTIEKFSNLLNTRKWKFSDYKMSNDFRERGILYNEKFEKDLRKIKFSCFCDSWRNPPMWYFYGGNYTGVCIEFSVGKLIRKYKNIELKRIDYLCVNDPKSWSINVHSINDYFTIKTKDWEYEKEIRLFYTGRYKFLFDILSCATKIYIGHNCILNLLKDDRLCSIDIEYARCWPDGTISSL